MISFRAHDAEGGVIGIGITLKTWNDLLQGKVVPVDLTRLGIPGVKLMVVGGKDEVSITRDLQQYIGRETGVHIPPGLITRNPQ